MTENSKAPTISRRELAGMTAAIAALSATPALAAQPHMEKALSYCRAGLDELRAANNNKGGYRKSAIEHLEYAIQQIQLGIDHAS